MRKRRRWGKSRTEGKDSPFAPCEEESWPSRPHTSLRSGEVLFGRPCSVTDFQNDLGQGISSYCISAPQLLSRDDTASLSHRSGLKVCEAFKYHSPGSHKNSLSRQIHHARSSVLLSPHTAPLTSTHLPCHGGHEIRVGPLIWQRDCLFLSVAAITSRMGPSGGYSNVSDDQY